MFSSNKLYIKLFSILYAVFEKKCIICHNCYNKANAKTISRNSYGCSFLPSSLLYPPFFLLSMFDAINIFNFILHYYCNTEKP